MIVLCTDFGLEGPYTGQVKAVLLQQAPATAVVDLFSDLPVCNPKASAYLLSAYSQNFEPDTVFMCVVDPGVGSERDALILHTDQHWFVGPDNGLLEMVTRRCTPHELWRITWRPERLSSTFHGRDLFAPVAAMLSAGRMPDAEQLDPRPPRADYPNDLFEVVYIDHYGNAITGVRSAAIPESSVLSVNGLQIHPARTFSSMPAGQALWYANSNGQVEIAVNLGRACDVLGLKTGDAFTAGSK
ncbi:MAG TPA: hypothetical protein ENI64_05605 [Gammaproteobacteria bacterium]|nr:hypothetical protein [Gammaproteobacteria bacterium]